MTRIAPVLVGFLVPLAACGGAGHPAPAPVEEPDRCAADPSVAATRRPRPAGTGCMDQAGFNALRDACSTGDPDACDRFVGCQLLNALGTTADAASVAPARDALRIACDGGIAESCRLRVGVATADGSALPSDGCADLIRGCQLGDEYACYDCRNHCR